MTEQTKKCCECGEDKYPMEIQGKFYCFDCGGKKRTRDYRKLIKFIRDNNKTSIFPQKCGCGKKHRLESALASRYLVNLCEPFKNDACAVIPDKIRKFLSENYVRDNGFNYSSDIPVDREQGSFVINSICAGRHTNHVRGGCVYCIEKTNTHIPVSCYKIGVTGGTASEREKTFQQEPYNTTRVEHSIDCCSMFTARVLEKWLHDFFAEKRVVKRIFEGEKILNEHFNLDNFDLCFIRNITGIMDTGSRKDESHKVSFNEAGFNDFVCSEWSGEFNEYDDLIDLHNRGHHRVLEQMQFLN